jgi:hypothetical protein
MCRPRKKTVATRFSTIKTGTRPIQSLWQHFAVAEQEYEKVNCVNILTLMIKKKMNL